jgi:hypothetical protein
MLAGAGTADAVDIILTPAPGRLVWKVERSEALPPDRGAVMIERNQREVIRENGRRRRNMAATLAETVTPDMVVSYQIRPGMYPQFRHARGNQRRPLLKRYRGSVTLVSPGKRNAGKASGQPKAGSEWSGQERPTWAPGGGTNPQGP